MQLSVAKLAIAVIVLVVIGLIGWFIYLEHRMDRFMASVRTPPSDTAVAPIESESMAFVPTEPSEVIVDPELDENYESDEHINGAETDADLEELFFASDDWQPEPAPEVVTGTVKLRNVSFEEGRKHFMAEHGDSPEVRRYLDLLKMYLDDANMSQSQMLEFHKFHAYYVPTPENIKLYEALEDLLEKAVPGSFRMR